MSEFSSCVLCNMTPSELFHIYYGKWEHTQYNNYRNSVLVCNICDIKVKFRGNTSLETRQGLFFVEICLPCHE